MEQPKCAFLKFFQIHESYIRKDQLCQQYHHNLSAQVNSPSRPSCRHHILHNIGGTFLQEIANSFDLIIVRFYLDTLLRLFCSPSASARIVQASPSVILVI